MQRFSALCLLAKKAELADRAVTKVVCRDSAVSGEELVKPYRAVEYLLAKTNRREAHFGGARMGERSAARSAGGGRWGTPYRI
jgi:hypothetical protein